MKRKNFAYNRWNAIPCCYGIPGKSLDLFKALRKGGGSGNF